MDLQYFNNKAFVDALNIFFKNLNIPVNKQTDAPISAQDLLVETYKSNIESFQLIDDVYFYGMVDDAAFKGEKSILLHDVKEDYEGILIFGVTLKQRANNLLPTRSQLAEIARAFNREYFYTPVIVVFKYGEHLAFANTERLKYKQEWREGEKTGKVTLLRDINIYETHSGHERIILELKIATDGINKVDSFAKLYKYWQEVFSVNILNKKFFEELSNWYFWAIKQVIFPTAPTLADAHSKNAKLEDLLQEHKATNVIRMLTRLLFVWFIKEKKLIPEELFDLESLQKNILKEISPFKEKGIFKQTNIDSIYYKAILQNLFFASLNCPIKPDSIDTRERGFRGDGYGQNRGIDYLMRYKQYFKNPDAFLALINSKVPFLNGGLFECLDDKFNNVYIDGFSDQMTKGEQLIVPDYLFFGIEEKEDLSDIIGISNKQTKESAVKGLIKILKSYKFTITENTPIEEDIALDPELLGKVFENLLASFNPETKTTARKQTGSFYTPREIVNYMVDESLIAYLKNEITNYNISDEKLDEQFHQLLSYDNINPFKENNNIQKKIIKSLDKCAILDPACGSGAFPMGILQKMVHVLHKIDPKNIEWKQRQIDKVKKQIESAEEIEDNQFREKSIADSQAQIKDIEDAFENNELDYGRKLFLIENCIYGVDIQTIATQISKLRFFISLIVDQKIEYTKENFGIRPLPNLETKFVAANTLIGIEKPDKQLSLFESQEVKLLETELKKIRHKLFSAKSKDTKLKYRKKDEELRNAIAIELERIGWTTNTADKLAKWDPYNQNDSATFFDMEWMFNIKDGFDIVIGNPPYIRQEEIKEYKPLLQKAQYKIYNSTSDLYTYFYERAYLLLGSNKFACFITSNKWIRAKYGEKLRNFLRINTKLMSLIDFGGYQVFEATVDTNILLLQRSDLQIKYKMNFINVENDFISENLENYFKTKKQTINQNELEDSGWTLADNKVLCIKKKIEQIGVPLKKWDNSIYRGITTGFNEAFIINNSTKERLCKEDQKSIQILKPILRGRDINKYSYNLSGYWIIYSYTGIKIESYPAILNYLKQYRKQLEQVWEAKHGKKQWYELRGCDYYSEFEKEKIVWQLIVQKSSFAYEINKSFCLDTGFVMVGKNLKYLIALLNSKPVDTFFRKYYVGNTLGKNGYKYSKVYIEQLPLPKISETNQKSFINLVDKILSVKAKNPVADTSKLEQQIDELVYKLYNLTYDEIKVIEPNFWLSQKEYNNLPAIEAEEPQYNNIKNNPEETELSEPKTPKKRGSRGISVDGLEF